MKKIINLIILTKNRDLQARALLETFFYFSQSHIPVKITILYDDEEHENWVHRDVTFKFRNDFSYINFIKVSDIDINIEDYFVNDQYNLVLPDNAIFTTDFDLKYLYEVDDDGVLDLFKGLNRQKKSCNIEQIGLEERFFSQVHMWTRDSYAHLFKIPNGEHCFESVPNSGYFKYYGKIFVPNASTVDIVDRPHYFYPVSPCFINAINTVARVDYYDVEQLIEYNPYALATRYLCGETIDIDDLKNFSPNSLIYQYNYKFNTKFEVQTFTDIVSNGFYLNLEHREDRNVEIKHEIKNLPISVSRINAHVPEDSVVEQLINESNNIFTEIDIKVAKSRFGCSMSHLEAIKRAKDNNWDSVLVLEDDCKFIDNRLLPILDRAAAELSYLPKWDMLFLGANAISPIIQCSPHLGILTGAFCAHAYIVSNRFYDTILNFDWKKYFAIDQHYLALQRQLSHNIYTVLPLVANQRPSHSSITQQYENYQDVLINSYTKWINEI
jgi:GR25 family glycosyltransferase involved in LPS biosynthesis